MNLIGSGRHKIKRSSAILSFLPLYFVPPTKFWTKNCSTWQIRAARAFRSCSAIQKLQLCMLSRSQIQLLRTKFNWTFHLVTPSDFVLAEVGSDCFWKQISPATFPWASDRAVLGRPLTDLPIHEPCFWNFTTNVLIDCFGHLNLVNTATMRVAALNFARSRPALHCLSFPVRTMFAANLENTNVTWLDCRTDTITHVLNCYHNSSRAAVFRPNFRRWYEIKRQKRQNCTA